jgi:hypothetical protein
LTGDPKVRLQSAPLALLCGALCALVLTFAPGADAAPQLTIAPPVAIDSHPLSGVSCPSETLCVAVDRAGQALSSTSPGAAAGWPAETIDGGVELSAVSCPTSSLCTAVDEAGRTMSTLDPGPFAAWSAPQSIDPGSHLRSVSCTTLMCVAVDDAGRALTTTNPGPGSFWSPAVIDPGNHLRAVSCTGAFSCVAVDEAGNAFATENPFAGWHARALGPPLTAVSCFPGGCVASDSSGSAHASADPWSERPTWSSTPVTGSRPAGASCTPGGLCVLVDEGSALFASEHASAGIPEWSAATTAPGTSMAGVSCLPAGLCVAVDAAGHAVLARVPAPATTTVAPLEVTQSAATIAGVVDPNGAALADCHFEYGTTSAYGSVAPCASLPAPTGGAQQVFAQISGLEGNTTYHYRVIAATAGGTGVGGDQAFATAVTSGVALVNPHPSITGTPAVGQRLTCHTGIANPDSARISFAWLRDLLPIPGVSASSFVVRGGDAGFHIQCQVTASNAGGNASAKSAFVTIPIQGVPAAVGETSVSRARVRGTKISVPVRCSGDAGGGCQVVVRVTVVETISGGHVIAVAAGGSRARVAASRGARAAIRRATVTIAGVRVHLARGQQRTLVLALNRSGRALLAHRRSLPATLTVSGTVIGVIEASLAQQRIVLASRHGH